MPPRSGHHKKRGFLLRGVWMEWESPLVQSVVEWKQMVEQMVGFVEKLVGWLRGSVVCLVMVDAVVAPQKKK